VLAEPREAGFFLPIHYPELTPDIAEGRDRFVADGVWKMPIETGVLRSVEASIYSQRCAASIATRSRASATRGCLWTEIPTPTRSPFASPTMASAG